MVNSCAVLVISSDLESRRTLTAILGDLGPDINVFTCSCVAQATGVLSQQNIKLVLCQDRLTDGSFRDVLKSTRSAAPRPPVVVTTRLEGWDDYLEAVHLGAFDVIRYPYYPTDVEWTIHLAMRESANSAR